MYGNSQMAIMSLLPVLWICENLDWNVGKDQVSEAMPLHPGSSPPTSHQESGQRP